MLRRLIATLITVYAIAFAFGALSAVRWPSIMMILGWLVTEDVAGGLDRVDWRALGIAHGGPYLLAAFCFYASSAMIAARRRGAVIWYVMALAASIPCVFLVHFDQDWWRDPSAGEGALAGGAAGAILLLSAVWELRWRPPRAAELAAPEPTMVEPVPAPQPVAIVVPEADPAPVIKRRPAAGEWVFVPPAIARQRASFAAHGRRMHARRRA